MIKHMKYIFTKFSKTLYFINNEHRSMTINLYC